MNHDHDPYGYVEARARIASRGGMTDAWVAQQYPDEYLHELAIEHEMADSSMMLRVCDGNLYAFANVFRDLSDEEVEEKRQIKDDPWVWGHIDLFNGCATCDEKTHTTAKERAIVHEAMAAAYFWSPGPDGEQFYRKHDATMEDMERAKRITEEIGVINRDRCVSRRAVAEALTER